MLNDKCSSRREQSRLAMQRLVDKRNGAGLKRITFWATPEVQDLLELIQGQYTTRDEMLNTVLRRLSR